MKRTFGTEFPSFSKTSETLLLNATAKEVYNYYFLVFNINFSLQHKLIFFQVYRIRPVGPFGGLPRMNTEEDTLGGYLIPKNVCQKKKKKNT